MTSSMLLCDSVRDLECELGETWLTWSCGLFCRICCGAPIAKLRGGGCEEGDKVWGSGGTMRPMRVVHSMTKPELWLRLKEVRR